MTDWTGPVVCSDCPVCRGRREIVITLEDPTTGARDLTYQDCTHCGMRGYVCHPLPPTDAPTGAEGVSVNA